MPDTPCSDAPEDVTLLRDLGAFLSDGDSGFSGTDLLVMLRMENDFGGGEDPGMHGRCTGPLGAACPNDDWITQLIDLAVASPGVDMWDVASAVKDRMITAPTIVNEAEVSVLEDLMGESLSASVADVGAADAEAAARLLAGMLTNTPQFMLAGVPSRDQDEADDPVLVVDGTDTQSLCEYLAPFILTNATDNIQQSYSCSVDGVALD